MGIIPGMGVTEHESASGSKYYEYGGEYYNNYDDIPFATKQAYETTKEMVGDYFTTEWNKIPKPGQHLLRGAAGFLGKTLQDLDKQEYTIGPLKGLPTVGNLAMDTLRIADQGLTTASEFIERETGLYAPTAKVGGELAVDYLLTGGGGKILKGGKAIASQADDAITSAARTLFPQPEPVLVEGLLQGAIKDRLNSSSTLIPNTMFAATAARTAVTSASRTPNIYNNTVPVTKTGSASTEWFRVGGGLDQELEKVLTFGSGKNKRIVSYEELVELAKTNPNAQKKLDKYKSLLATPPASSTGDILIYGYEDKLLARTAGLQKHANYIPAYHKSLEFHHASMKALEFRIHRKARELLKAGKITEDDLVRLHNVGELKNIQSGSRAAAGIDMHRQSHNLLHKEIMLPKGIQPSHQPVGIKALSSKPKNISSDLWKQMKAIDKNITKFDTEYITAWGDKGIEKWKAFRKTESYKLISTDARSELSRLGDEIDSFNNIEDLINFRSDMIDNIVTPMTDEALLLERALDKLSPTEILRLDDDITPLRKVRDMQISQEAAKKTHQQETLIEDAMRQAYD